MNSITLLRAAKPALIALLILVGLPAGLLAQARYRSVSSTVSVSGTSTLHDWKESSAKGTANAVLMLSGDKLTGLSMLLFTVPVKTLKSEHKTMDNNTYKALKSDKHPDITYALSSATVTPVNASTYTVRTRGKLSIAGVTRETEVVGTAKLNADKTINVSGSKKLKMTDYGVTPPKVMMIKAGNEVTVSYSVKLTQ